MDRTFCTSCQPIAPRRLPAAPLNAPAPRPLRDSLVAAALSLLHEDLAAPWDVATLAAKLWTSRPTLARRFMAEVRLSPRAYLTQARMHEAARLARETDRTLIEIAEAVGYTSVSAFNRAFLREHGTPPGAFRKQDAAKKRGLS